MLPLGRATSPLACFTPTARAFARAGGLTAKTDAVDAAMLTRFGRALRPAPTPAPTAVQRQLAEFVTRRRQIMDLVVMEKNRRRGHTLLALIRDAVKTLKGLEKSIAAIDAMVAELQEKDGKLKKKVSRLTELQGIGAASACALYMPALTASRMNPRLKSLYEVWLRRANRPSWP